MNMFIAIALILVAAVVVVGYVAYRVHRVEKAFPEEARIKNLKVRYADLIKNLDEAIEQSDTALSLAKKLEDIQYPKNTLSVSMKADSQHEFPIFNRFAPRKKSMPSHSYMSVVNGGGHGEKNGQSFLALEHPLNQYDYQHIEVLIGLESSASHESTTRLVDDSNNPAPTNTPPVS